MKDAFSEEENQDLGSQIPRNDVQLKSSVLIILPWAAGVLLPLDLHLLDPHQAPLQKGDFPCCSLLQGPNLDLSVIWRCEEAEQPCSVGSSHWAWSLPG